MNAAERLKAAMKNRAAAPTEARGDKVTENGRPPADTPFVFKIELLDEIIEMIHQHTISSYTQITAIVILDFAYILAYGALMGTAHYVFDKSPSGGGKDSAANQSFELVLNPVMKIQNERKKQDDYERQNSEEDLPVRSFHCIHTSDATPQGTYRAFETTKAQYLRLGEIGNKMRNKEHPLMNFITDGYGKRTLTQPNYKKDLGGSGDLTVNGIGMFFYGNSNIQMMGLSTLLHHLQGGLLNRCVLIYNTYTRPFEDKPHDFDLPYAFVSRINASIQDLIQFAERHSGMAKPSIPRTEAYEAFDRYVYEQTDAFASTNVRDLFRRTMQNLNAIILTLHYLECWQSGEWRAEIAESTVLTGVKYMKYIIDGYDVLIDEITGAAKDERAERNTEKLHSKVRELAGSGAEKIKHRELYRALHLSRKEYGELLGRANYRTDKTFLYPAPRDSGTGDR